MSTDDILRKSRRNNRTRREPNLKMDNAVRKKDPNNLYFLVEDDAGNYVVINERKEGSRWREEFIDDKNNIVKGDVRYFKYSSKKDLIKSLYETYPEVEEISKEEALKYR